MFASLRLKLFQALAALFLDAVHSVLKSYDLEPSDSFVNKVSSIHSTIFNEY
jgi:hypothetical protein